MRAAAGEARHIGALWRVLVVATHKDGKEIRVDARLDFSDNPAAMKFGKYVNSAGAAFKESTLPAATQELVKIRASQINGCAVCLDGHTKEAQHAGESSVRLNLVAAWRPTSSPRPNGRPSN
ncbi:MAG: carboxymuconolactone decarboxylase family protein [Acidimicrobiales bacterium]